MQNPSYIINDTWDREHKQIRTQSTQVDISGKSSFNSIFGDHITGTRESAMSMNFCYPLDSRQYISEVVGSGTVTTANSLLTVSTGTDVNGKAVFETVKSLIYKSAHDAYCHYTFLLTQGKANSRQKIGIFNEDDGFSVGFEGTDFAVFHDRGGSNLATITQANFNVDKLDGTGNTGFVLDPTKLNLCRINYGYQGGSPIFFEILTDDGWKLFHKIQFNNRNIITNLTLPYLKFRVEVENLGNDTDIVAKSGSIEFGIINGGKKSPSAREFTFFNSVTGYTAGTNKTLVVFHSKDTFGGLPNRLEAQLEYLTCAVEGNKPLTLLMYRLTEAPTGGTWTDVGANSFAEYSFNTVPNYSTAELLLPISLGKSDGSGIVDVTAYNYIAYPDNYIAFAFTTAGAGDLQFGFRYSELH